MTIRTLYTSSLFYYFVYSLFYNYSPRRSPSSPLLTFHLPLYSPFTHHRLDRPVPPATKFIVVNVDSRLGSVTAVETDK